MNGMIALLALSMMGGCWEKRVKHLSDTEFDHYYALRPFMDEDMKKTYLKLKTQEERDAYLKEQGLWDRFYQYEADEREAIVMGDVQEGWTKDKVLMSWGSPYDKRKGADMSVTRSEILVYRFEGHDSDDDGKVDTHIVWEPNSKTEYKAEVLFRKEVHLANDVVTLVELKDGWS
ncbi:MAG: hypothetical protein VX899_23960 [Myxococcota bacterium]|nr:hypothetical protein [Myxococcota bacterium]